MLPKLSVRDIIAYSEVEIWTEETLPHPEYTILFDDGSVDLFAEQIRINWYYWILHREFPSAPTRKDWCLSGMFTAASHLDLGSKLIYGIFDTMPDDLKERGVIWSISKCWYEITNLLTNMASDQLGEYLTTSSYRDLVEICHYPEIAAIRKECHEKLRRVGYDSSLSREIINDGLAKIKDILFEDITVLPRNGIKQLCNTRSVRVGGILQLVFMRGYPSDISGVVYHLPIENGYAQGLRHQYDHITESRSATRSLMMTDKPLEDSEHHNKIQQHHGSVIHSVVGETCVGYKTHAHVVEANDGNYLRGKYHMVDGDPKMIWDHLPLVGTTVHLRVAPHCNNPDPQTICAICSGYTRHLIPPNTNYGFALVAELCQRISQEIMSNKHYEGSASFKFLELTEAAARRLKLGKDDQSMVYVTIPAKTALFMRIDAQAIPRLNSILSTDISELSPTRMSNCKVLEFADFNKANKEEMLSNWSMIDVTVTGAGASLSAELLQYLKTHGWETRGGFVTVDLSHWDASDPLLYTPRRGDNVYLFLAAFRSFIVGAGGDPQMAKLMGKKNITHYQTVAAAIAELTELVRTRIDAPLAIIEIFVKACMAIDPDNGDYRLPRANDPWTFVNADVCLSNRCLSTALTYRVQDEVLLDGDWYTPQDRTIGFTDAILYSEQV